MRVRRFVILAFILGVVSILVGAQAASAGVTSLQNGVSPGTSYAGCRDTWISNEQWERNRDQGASETLGYGGERHVLVRFDLSPIPGGDRVHRALLRLADTGFPRSRDGRFPASIRAFVLTRAWNENANWLEHTRTDYKEAGEGDWKTPGGECDVETNFGHDEKGLVALDFLYAGRRGHLHELDITAAVRCWHRGTLPNHGLLLKGVSRGEVASSEWPVATYRPQLVIDHGGAPSGIAALVSAPREISLDPISATPDTGKPREKYSLVRVYGGAHGAPGWPSACAYIKENTTGFPGTWGWMDHARVGGVAGDFNRTLLYFDLGRLPAETSIRAAQLVCSLVPQTAQQVRSYRYGAFLVRLPEAPGWDESEATASARRAGVPWPGGGAAACAGDLPLAIGNVVQKELELRGRKRKVDAEIEFDLTGAVRAWVSGKVPNCGVMLDNRIEGGVYDMYSSRVYQPARRPRLEITLSPAVAVPAPARAAPSTPSGDYWVDAMREVHRRFSGRRGTMAQYGDSITVTMAFLGPYGWGKKINAKNVAAGVRGDLDLVESHADLGLWVKWKGGEWGNTGMMMSDWLFRNVAGWQERMLPEAAVVMFGTNDIGRIWPPAYTENMAASLRRMMGDGTVPLLTSIPPCQREGHREYWLAALSIARGLKVPLIDYHAEILRRRPDDWNGRLDQFSAYRDKVYEVPTLVSADGTHPSNPKPWQNDFSQEALDRNGYNLRNYMTIRAYAEVIREVLRDRTSKAPTAAGKGMVTRRFPAELSGERRIRFDLSALPARTKVFRADLVLGRTEPVTGAHDAALAEIEIRSLFGPAAEAEASEPLALQPPGFDRFDATAAVQRWVSRTTRGGFRVKTCPLWDPGANYLDVAYEGQPEDVPLQVTGLRVFHRGGATFVTWNETSRLVRSEQPTWGEIRRALREHGDSLTYRIYAHKSPIQPTNLHQAERLAEVRPLSAYNVNGRNMEHLIGEAMVEPDALGELARDYNGYMYTWGMESERMDRYPVGRFVVDEGAGRLPAGTGLYVHHPSAAGTRYYAVVSCRDGVENTRDFSPANSLAAPVDEAVGPGEPVLQGPGLWGPYFDYPGQRQVYVAWRAPPLAPRPNMPFNWSVLLPPDIGGGRRLPVELTLHSGNFSHAKPRKKYMRDSIQIAPHDYPFSGWYGFHEAYGTWKSWRAGAVRNETQRRILSFLEWAAEAFPVDRDRVVLCGADGAALLAMGFRDAFAYVLVTGFGGRGKEYGRVLDPRETARFASAWGPKSPRIRDEYGRAEWGWTMLGKLALERPAEAMPLLACEGGSWGGVRGYGKAFGPFYANLQEARQPLLAGFGWNTKLIAPEWYSGLWQRRRDVDAAGLDMSRRTPIPAFANSSCSVEKLQSGNINWMHTWRDVEDEPDRFAITLGGAGRVDMTPRRLQAFQARPGETLHFRAEPLRDRQKGETPAPQTGSVTADGDGLFTLSELQIPRAGLVVRVTREADNRRGER